ncbi:hypothetical protein Mapa_006514 [Marchantia paleacea]|nr:hypothetical protein Mapa_006514 [Marchantia paleacea]
MMRLPEKVAPPDGRRSRYRHETMGNWESSRDCEKETTARGPALVPNGPGSAGLRNGWSQNIFPTLC